MQFTAEMIAGFLKGEIVGDKNATVGEFAKIEEGRPGALSFLANPKYEHYVYETESSIVIVGRDFTPTAPVAATLIRVEDAYAAFASLLRLYDENRPRPRGISPHAAIADDVVMGDECYIGNFAVVEEGVRMGERVLIYPQCYIGKGVTIGDRTTIHAGVKIYEGCVIGSGVIIHSGAVIGADGFGFAPGPDGVYAKIPQLGNVVLEDGVDIGANTCVDRATMGSTIIRRGVKLDNLIQVGHNAVIGEDTVCAAQVGVAGTSKVGSRCMFGGQVGIAGHLTVGDNVIIASKGGISNNVPDNMHMIGYPALPAGKFHRSNAVFRQLPDLSKLVYALEKRVKNLEDNEIDN
jgi:UDP-3-O-[3-hydroxymyristoyl] glucosamine N-acyltransferase